MHIRYFISLAILNIFLLNTANALDLENIAREESKKPFNVIVPFTEKEIIDLVKDGKFAAESGTSFLCDFDMFSPKHRRQTGDEILLCKKRLKEFIRITFGGCQKYYLDEAQLGFILNGTRYATGMYQEERKDRLLSDIKRGYDRINAELEPHDLRASCTNAHAQVFKTLVSKIFDAESQAKVERDQYVADKKKSDNDLKLATEKSKASEKEAKELAERQIRETRENDIAQKATIVKQCRERPDYKLFVFSSNVVILNDRLNNNQSIIAREKKIAATSGYENKSVIYKAGMEIVDDRAYLERSFAEYRKLGGNASKPAAVQILNNPCSHLE